MSQGSISQGGTGQGSTGQGRSTGEWEAFLAGHWVEHLSAQGRAVPRWAWLNRVAHADWAGLADLADNLTAAARSGDEGSWAASFLAAELIELTAGDPNRIRRAQESVLVAIELGLLEEGEAAGGTTRHLLSACEERLRSELS